MWQELAVARLGTILTLAGNIKTQLTAARQATAPLIAAVNAENARSDDLLGKVSDDIWNAVGRPANDPWLSIIFPGGYACYAEGEVESQPTRMEILARLLESNLHPKLSPEKGQAAAAEVRASAGQLRQALEAGREPLALVDVLERVLTAVARNAAIEMANLKRAYKIAGFSEADIHTVIPDRPRRSAAAKAAPAKPAPASPPAESPAPADA